MRRPDPIVSKGDKNISWSKQKEEMDHASPPPSADERPPPAAASCMGH
jgi:hypothetical protein